MTLTDKQEKAIKLAKEWYMSELITKPFVILGVAGAGKTTIVKYLIEEIGIDKNINVKYVTFTGKAASVLIKKGNPATTIHKLIYDPVIDEDGNIEDFVLKSSLDENIKLIIVDEFYMVEDKIMKDLLSFKTKIICLGDNHQLPPPMGNASNLCNKPDVVLNEPLRQSLDNPIIYLANQVLQHNTPKVGDYGNNVIVTRKTELDLNRLRTADQIIVGKNKTVQQMNKFYRKYFKQIPDDQFLPQKGEKLICLKNNWKLKAEENNIITNLVNGLSLTLENNLDMINSTRHAYADLKPDFFDGSIFRNTIIDMLYFQYGFTKEDELYNKTNIKKFDYGSVLGKRKIRFGDTPINKLTFGYAITCHKSQGSEFKDVYFIFEPFGNFRQEIYWQMLYTGLTRASESIVIAI